jgi:hypothetical protein
VLRRRGGQIGLDLAALAFAIFVLWPLKWAERWLGHHRRGMLSITAGSADPIEKTILPRFVAAGFQIGECELSLGDQGKTCTMRCDIRWHDHAYIPLAARSCARIRVTAGSCRRRVAAARKRVGVSEAA